MTYTERERQPNTTTHDSIPAETDKNDGDGTSGDCISRQAVTKFLNDWLSCLFENCHKQSASDLKMIIKDFKNLPSAQPEHKTGRWTLRRVTYLWEGVECEKFETRCSSCGCLPISGIKSTYCPNCGADMRGEQE